MSQFPAKTQGEGIWQYCNYGYDRNKYASYADCMDKKCNEAGLGGGGLMGCKTNSNTNIVEGCMDETANNYNIEATFDDYTCTYDNIQNTTDNDQTRQPRPILQAGEKCSDFGF